MLKVICINDDVLDIRIPASGETERWTTSAIKGVVYTPSCMTINESGLLCYRIGKNDSLACRFVEIEQDILVLNK